MAERDAPDSEAGVPGAFPKRKRWRRILIAVAVLVLGLGVLLALGPTLLSTGFVRGRVAARAGRTLGAPVEIGSLSFSWLGTQRVESLRVGPPPGAGQEEDLLRVESVTLDRGFLGLVFGSGEPLRLEVRRPVLHLRREPDGRFAWEGLGGGRLPGDGGPQGPGDAGGGPGSWPHVELALHDGEVHWTDAAEGVASSLTALEVTARTGRDTARLELAARVAGSGAERAGRIRLEAVAEGLEDRPTVRAEGALEDLDLRPWRALLEERWRLRPPERPVQGTFALRTEDGALRGTLDLDAGAAALRGVSLRIPQDGEPAPRAARLEVPFEVDLAALRSVLALRSGLREDARLAGTLDGSLVLTGPLTVASLRAAGRPVAGLRAELSVGARDLLWAPGGDTGGAGEPSGRSPRAPRALDLGDRLVRLRVAAQAGEDGREVALEAVRLDAPGLEAELTGSLRGRGREEGDDGARRAAAPPLEVDLRLGARARLEELEEPLRPWLPEGLEVSEGAEARLEELDVRGPLGGPEPPLRALRAGGGFAITGGVRWSGAALERLSGELRASDGVVAVRGLEAGVNGGTLRGKELRVGLAEETPPWHVALELEELALDWRLEPLLAWVLPFVHPGGREASITGALASEVELEGRGFGLPALRESLRGRGSLRVRDGRLRASPFLDELGRVLGARFDRLVFAETGSDFTVGEGAVRSGNLFLSAPEGAVRSIAFEGRTTFDRELDYGLRLSALEDVIGDPEVRSVLGAVREVLGDPELPLRLRGTLTRPRLSLAEDAVRGLLEKALEKGARRGLEEVLRGGVDRLLRGGPPAPAPETPEEDAPRGESSGTGRPDGKRPSGGLEGPLRDRLPGLGDFLRPGRTEENREEDDPGAAEEREGAEGRR